MDPCPKGVDCCRAADINPQRKLKETLTTAYKAADNLWRVCTTRETCDDNVCVKEPEVCHKDTPMLQVQNRNAAVIAPSTTASDGTTMYVPSESANIAMANTLYYADRYDKIDAGTALFGAADNIQIAKCLRSTPQSCQFNSNSGTGQKFPMDFINQSQTNKPQCCPDPAVQPSLINGKPISRPVYNVPILRDLDNIDDQTSYKSMSASVDPVLQYNIMQARDATKARLQTAPTEYSDPNISDNTADFKPMQPDQMRMKLYEEIQEEAHTKTKQKLYETFLNLAVFATLIILIGVLLAIITDNFERLWFVLFGKPEK